MLVAKNPGFPYFLPETQVSFFETAVQELTAQSGIAEDQQIWIGFHEGADTLLDEIVYGSKTAKAAALIAPTLNTQHVDDAIIVDGNYQTRVTGSIPFPLIWCVNPCFCTPPTGTTLHPPTR